MLPRLPAYFNEELLVLNTGEKMAFNNGNSAEKRSLVNPEDLRFTQPDIKSTFTDPTYPSVRETISLLRRGLLSAHVLGPLHVSDDEQGNMWSDNNRRLFALREAGVASVTVVFDGNRRPKDSLKSKLSDAAFMPRIRGEASRVQIPPPPNSGRNGYQMQKEPEPSLPGSVSVGYLNREPYSSHEDEYEDELGAMFGQLAIKSTSTGPTYPTRREWGEVNPDDSEGFMPTILGFYESGVQISPSPSSSRNACEMVNEASLLDCGYSNRQYHEVHYKYSYEEDGTLKDEGITSHAQLELVGIDNKKSYNTVESQGMTSCKRMCSAHKLFDKVAEETVTAYNSWV